MSNSQSTQSVAPPEVSEVSPRLAQYTDAVLFGDLWEREGLSPRDRSLITVASLIAADRTIGLVSHVARGLDNGLSPIEIAEIPTQLAFYAGWPCAIAAVHQIRKVFGERGIRGALTSNEPLTLDPDAEQSRKAIIAMNVEPISRPLADFTNEVLFGDLWLNTDLAPRDRSLVTVAALVTLGQPEQMTFHVNRAMDNGLSGAELEEVIAHLAFYAGWPRAMSAVGAIKAILAGRAG